MKFRLKITISMLWILALAFGVGGSLLIMLGFSGNFEREMQSALSSYKMVLNTLGMVDETGPVPDHSNLSQALMKLDSQGSGGWSAIRLGDEVSVLYEDNSIGLNLSESVPQQEGSAHISVIDDMHGENTLKSAPI